VAVARQRSRRRRRAPYASQLLLPSCFRSRHHRAESAPQRFRRGCQAAVTATVASTITARCRHFRHHRRAAAAKLPPPPPSCRHHRATAKLPHPSCRPFPDALLCITRLNYL
jgi:hypothetical protein